MKASCIAFVLIFPLACSGQDFCITPQGVSEQYKESLQGKVKKIRYSYEISNDKLQLRTKSPENLYCVDSFSNSGSKLYSNQIQNGIVMDRFKFQYDNKGNIAELYWDEGSTTMAHTTFIYDDNGNRIQKRIYSIDGRLCRWVKYKYVSGLIKMEEDSAGHVEKTFYTYNNKRKLIGANIYEGREDTTKITYDDEGNKISVTYVSGTNNRKYSWKYDEHNNQILKEYHRSDGTIIPSLATEYIYDSYGNWTRKIEDIPNDVGDADVLYKLTVRDIEYY